MLLTDQFRRTATDLRLSVTDVCNLRCQYCLPEHGVSWLPRTDILTTNELIRIARVGIQHLGIRKVRLTGGEPLLRPDLEAVIRGIRDGNSTELALTTNGIGLAERATHLSAAGLDRVNISLDTLTADNHQRLTRRPGHDRILAGIDAAAHAYLHPRLNTVLLRGVNDTEIHDLITYAVDRHLEIRFIEHMPIGASRQWAATNLVTADDILTTVHQRYETTPVTGRGTAPSQRYHLSSGGTHVGTIGIIASATNPFCHTCDRTRISADGQLRSCLFSTKETDLRTPLREGATDAELAERWHATMAAKPRAHGKNAPGFDHTYVQPARGMHAIGG